MSGYTIAWLAWLGAFGVIEGLALANKRQNDTLSEHIWRWFATQSDGPAKPTGWIRARRFILVAFLAWLSAHFLSGGRF